MTAGNRSSEVAALVAVIEGDTAKAVEILEDFFPSELKQLIEKAEQLGDLADQVMRGKSGR